MPFVVTPELGNELVKRGLVEAGCRVLSIEFVAGEVAVIKYERFLETHDLAKVGAAIVAAFAKESEG